MVRRLDSPAATDDQAGPAAGVKGRRGGRRFWLLCGVAVAALVLLPIWSFGYLPFLSGPPVVRVTEYCGGNLAALTFKYSGPEQGYLSSDTNNSPQYCTSVSLPPRSTYETPLAMHNTDSRYAHSIDSIDIASPFQLAGTSPSLPAEISQAGNGTVVLTIRVPSYPGSYGLPSATVYAS